jgi:hypothetical protein
LYTPFLVLSEVLLKPVVGKWLIVEGRHLVISRSSVQRDGLSEGAVRLEANDADPCFSGVALELRWASVWNFRAPQPIGS